MDGLHWAITGWSALLIIAFVAFGLWMIRRGI